MLDDRLFWCISAAGGTWPRKEGRREGAGDYVCTRMSLFTALLQNKRAKTRTASSSLLLCVSPVDTFLFFCCCFLLVSLLQNMLPFKAPPPPPSSLSLALRVSCLYRVCARSFVLGLTPTRNTQGLHNWIQIYSEEKKGRLDYMGYIFPRQRGYEDTPAEDEQLITVQVTGSTGWSETPMQYFSLTDSMLCVFLPTPIIVRIVLHAVICFLCVDVRMMRMGHRNRRFHHAPARRRKYHPNASCTDTKRDALRNSEKRRGGRLKVYSRASNRDQKLTL